MSLAVLTSADELGGGVNVLVCGSGCQGSASLQIWNKTKIKMAKSPMKFTEEFIIYLLGEDDSRSLPSWQAAPGDGDTGDLRHLDQFGSHYFDARKLTKDFRSVLFKSTASQNVWRGL